MNKWQTMDTAPKCGRAILILEELPPTSPGGRCRTEYECCVAVGFFSAANFPGMAHVWLDGNDVLDEPTNEQWNEYEMFKPLNFAKYWCELPCPPQGFVTMFDDIEIKS